MVQGVIVLQALTRGYGLGFMCSLVFRVYVQFRV